MTLLSDCGMARMMIGLLPEVKRAFSAGDFGLFKSWGAAPGSPRRIRPVADWPLSARLTALCTGFFNRAAIDRRAAPSRDEFPKLSISFVWFVGLNYPQTRVEHRKTPCL